MTAIRSQRGFTLIELMVTVAIIALLAAIAIPNYQDYVKKAHRAAAAQFVADVANLQHQYMLDNRTYATTLAALGIPSVPGDVADFFNVEDPIDVDTGVAPYEFTIRATGTGMHSGETIEVNHLNDRCGPEGAWGEADPC